MIDVEDWAEIRRLHRAEGMSIKAIGRRVGVARNTVREALRSTEPPRYQRPGTGSLVDVVEPAIRGLLGEFPSMPVTVIAERIGWAHGMTILKERVRELRPLFQPPDGCQRTFYRPGELAQWDLWQPDIAIPVGHGQEAKQWTVVGVAGFSRLIGGWMVPSRKASDVLGGMGQVLGQFGGGAPDVGVGSGGLHRPLDRRTSTSDRGVPTRCPTPASPAFVARCTIGDDEH